MWSLTINTPPASLPISVADMHAHLRLNDTSEDAMLSTWISAAAAMYESDTMETLVPTVYTLTLDNYPQRYFREIPPLWAVVNGLNTESNPILYLPRYPVTNIDDNAIQYLDVNAQWQTLPTVAFDLSSTPARIIIDTNLPVLHPSQLPNVRVTFTAGYSSVPALPATLLKLAVAHWFDHRNAYGEKLDELPHGWRAICSQRRLNLLGDWNK